MQQNIDDAADPAGEALAELQHGFDGAKQLVKEARILLAGDPAESAQGVPVEAAQATLAPSSDTVQNPAAE